MLPIVMKLPEFPIDYVFLMDQLKDYRSPRAKVTQMLQKAELIRIKKGLYVRSPEWGGKVNRCVLANLVYGPSYISYEYALSHYGLIPERVEVLTCATKKRNRRFSTPVGCFTYQYLNNQRYFFGVTREQYHQSGFLIATPEKALCDVLALIKNITHQNEIPTLIEKDLRINLIEIENLNKNDLTVIQKIYSNKTINFFVDWFIKNF